MVEKSYFHKPVLLEEVIEILQPGVGQTFVDATLGGAGYSQALLEAVGFRGRVVSVDLDRDAVENARRLAKTYPQWLIIQENFRHIDKIAEKYKLNKIQGIVADLGFSSYELDQSERGLSFQKDEPLDMRFDQTQPEDARFVLASRSEAELERIFREYGEEKFSKQIARRIKAEEAVGHKLTRTRELYVLIEQALPKPFKHKAPDSARRVFQALRIAVNHELENLEVFLPKAFDVLAPGGRLAVVTFHSLEDRLTKQYFADLAKGCVCPPEFPECLCGRKPLANILTKKPITPSAAEIQKNSRSRPAKLRAIAKL